MEDIKKIVVAIIRDAQDKVLIVKRNKEETGNDGSVIRWVFPGGKIELGETLEAAAERETFEESGYRVKASQLIFESRHPQFPAYIYYFDCKLLSDVQESEPASDISECRWVPANCLSDYFTTHLDERVKEFLEK